MSYIDTKNVIKIYHKCNKICPVCNNAVKLEDIYNNNFVYSKTHIGSHMLGHRKCIERVLLP